MTDEGKELYERFKKIRKAAWNGDALGEEFDFLCDHETYDRLANLFNGHRRDKKISKEEVFRKGNNLKAAYITAARSAKHNKTIYVLDQERYKRCAELRTQIIKSASEKTDFELLSMCIELMEKAFTDIDAKVITEKLMQRSDICMTPITKGKEGFIRDLLIELKVNHKLVDCIFEEAKSEGQGSYNGFMVRPSGENNFKLYHVPSAEYNKRS